ncbi:MAG: element excision factor XisH family protein [Cyanobacteria bacterium P01_G01_bin.54]
MPPRDAIHGQIRRALVKDGWQITDDPYVISYGERFLFIDLAARELVGVNELPGHFLGAECGKSRIAIEIKEFRGNSVIVNLEQYIGQYVLYRLLLDQVDPLRQLYLAISETTYNEVFQEAIGELVILELPMKIVVVDLEKEEVQ